MLLKVAGSAFVAIMLDKSGTMDGSWKYGGGPSLGSPGRANLVCTEVLRPLTAASAAAFRLAFVSSDSSSVGSSSSTLGPPHGSVAPDEERVDFAGDFAGDLAGGLLGSDS